MPKSKHREKKVNPHRKRVCVAKSEWDGVWYHIEDNAKAFVNEALPGKPFPFVEDLALPIRTPGHPGVYIRYNGKCLLCDVYYLQKKFTRLPSGKLEDARECSESGSIGSE